MKRNISTIVVNQAIVGGENRMNKFLRDFSWYVPQSAPNIRHPTLVREHIFLDSPKIYHRMQDVSVKDADAQDTGFFDKGAKDGNNVANYVLAVFLKRKRIDAR